MQIKHLKKEAKAYLLITLGMLIYSIAALGFLVPHKIVGGGATGLSTILYYLSGETIPVGIGYGLINILLVGIALKILGPKFGAKTVFAILVGSVLMSILQPLIPEAFVSDKFMSTIIAGIFAGLGISIALSVGGSTGGTDIIAMIVTKYRNISAGRMLMYCDCIVILCSLLINFNIEGLMYGFVMMGVVAFTVDFILTGRKQSAQLFIFSEQYELVADRVSKEIGHGVTVVDCIGWYSGQAKKMLFVVVPKNQAIDVLRIAKHVDPNVFMTMNTVMGVFGQGFEEVQTIK